MQDSTAEFRKPLRVIAALACLLAAPSASGQERSYHLASFHAEIVVAEDGALNVTERLTFVFDGSFNGIYRDIPWRYRTPWGLDYELRITPGAVLSDEGLRLEHEAGRRGDDYRFKVWIPGAVDTSKTVTLSYEVRRGLRFFEQGEEGFEDERDELYWNVTGFWDVPIDRATATVSLPAGAGTAMTRSYTGAYGSTATGPAATQTGAGQHVFRADGLAAGEGLTIVVAWPSGVVDRPTAFDEIGYLLADNWPLFVPVFVFVLMFAAHRRWGKDPAVNRSVMVQYEPPGGFRPAELGTLIDEKVDLRDVVATVIDLGVRGYLRIEEEAVEGWFRDSTKTRLIRMKASDGELRDYERTILDGLFRTGDDVALEELETKFYKHVDTVRKAIYNDLTEQGLFRARPDTVRATWLFLAMAALVASVVLGAFLGRPAFFFAAPLVGLTIAGFGWNMPARTRRGRETYVQLRGFEEFLGRTEEARLRELELPETTFERYLPHAMALGIAAHWASAFAGLVKEPPQWYRGSGGPFDTVMFTNHMTSLNSRMGSAMVSQPRSTGSSGGSGFSGGGFSGGGFGGGGGGAF